MVIASPSSAMANSFALLASRVAKATWNSTYDGNSANKTIQNEKREQQHRLHHKASLQSLHWGDMCGRQKKHQLHPQSLHSSKRNTLVGAGHEALKYQKNVKQTHNLPKTRKNIKIQGFQHTRFAYCVFLVHCEGLWGTKVAHYTFAVKYWFRDAILEFWPKSVSCYLACIRSRYSNLSVAPESLVLIN